VDPLPTGFGDPSAADDFMADLASNHYLAIGISLLLAIINLVLALITVRLARSLTKNGDL
ncbi:MAG: hypothetical protein AAFY46_16650, partial [Planctomycetota bacterium]